MSIRLEVDEVEVELALQVGARLGVARHDDADAVRRPIEVGDVPGAARQLLGVTPSGRNHKQVVVAAVDIPPAVLLVVEPADDARDRRPAKLLAAFRGPRVVDHRLRVGQHRADEGDPRAVGGPLRKAHAVRNCAQRLGRTTGRDVDHEQLVDRTNSAEKCQLAAVWRPLGRVVAKRAAGWFDRLGVEQAADDYAAPVLARARVRPADLVRDTFAVACQANMVKPAKTKEILRREGPSHPVPRMLPAHANSDSANVPFPGIESVTILSYNVLA